MLTYQNETAISTVPKPSVPAVQYRSMHAAQPVRLAAPLRRNWWAGQCVGLARSIVQPTTAILRSGIALVGLRADQPMSPR